MSNPKLDLLFPLQGEQVPVEHGYLLYAAIAHHLETPADQWLHESEAIGLHLIRGRRREWVETGHEKTRKNPRKPRKH